MQSQTARRDKDGLREEQRQLRSHQRAVNVERPRDRECSGREFLQQVWHEDDGGRESAEQRDQNEIVTLEPPRKPLRDRATGIEFSSWHAKSMSVESDPSC